jgi:hypothetical protein
MSVTVAPMNRAHNPETVCLASLAVEESPKCVELIGCDVGADTATEAAVREWRNAHPDRACTYVHAAHHSSCGQRNQAMF